MKRILSIVACAALWCGCNDKAPRANDPASATNPAAASPSGAPEAASANASGGEFAGTNEVRQLIRRVDAKLQRGQDREEQFAAELKEFDELAAKHKTTSPKDAAHAAFMKALLYVQVFENNSKAAELMKAVERDYPETEFAEAAGKYLTALAKQERASKIRANLVVGQKFPDFSETDLNGKPFSLAAYKGKVVLIDFWATWCGPCRVELPNVLAAYEKFHNRGFEILGISLDEDRKKLLDFIEAKGMKWPQYFDGKGWETKLAQDYGIQGIPATFLVDGDGTIVATDLRGDDLSAAVEKALAKK